MRKLCNNLHALCLLAFLDILRFYPKTQVFFNWKNQLRTRAKKLKQIQDGKTGLDDKLALQKLTDVEKRALKLWKEDFQDKDIASVGARCSRPGYLRLYTWVKYFCILLKKVRYGIFTRYAN